MRHLADTYNRTDTPPAVGPAPQWSKRQADRAFHRALDRFLNAHTEAHDSGNRPEAERIWSLSEGLLPPYEDEETPLAVTLGDTYYTSERDLMAAVEAVIDPPWGKR